MNGMHLDALPVGLQLPGSHCNFTVSAHHANVYAELEGEVHVFTDYECEPGEGGLAGAAYSRTRRAKCAEADRCEAGARGDLWRLQALCAPELAEDLCEAAAAACGR